MPSSKAGAINLRWLAIYSLQANQLQTRFLGPANQDTLSSASFMNRTSSTRLEMIFTLTSRINLRPFLYMKPLVESFQAMIWLLICICTETAGVYWLQIDRLGRGHMCVPKRAVPVGINTWESEEVSEAMGYFWHPLPHTPVSTTQWPDNSRLMLAWRDLGQWFCPLPFGG